MKETNSKAYLLLGSNLGDRLQLLASARNLIEISAGNISQISPIFETAAWGKTDLPAHLNQALCISTPLDCSTLLDALQKIENQLGRERQEQWGARTMDIDIIFYNEEIIDIERLKVPHPYLQDRRFALTPINAIASNYYHPILKKTVAQLLEACEDPLPVVLFEEKPYKF